MVGQAMTYWVLKSNGYVLARSTVRPLTEEERKSPDEHKAQELFNTELKEKIGDFDPNLIHATNEVYEDTNWTSQTDPEHKTDEYVTIPSTEHDELPGPELLINAEVVLPRGDRMEIAKILKRKRNEDGLFIGRKGTSPATDSRIFTVVFKDGEEKDISYNILAEHLYSQIDSEGRQYRLFKEIINHRKNKRALDKADGSRLDKRSGRIQKKKTTAGWDLEVEWKDGTTCWIPLKEIKETNPVEVAQYVIDNRIDEEPAFDWWVKYTLKKLHRLISKTQRHTVRHGYKFGIRIPRTVDEALLLDAANNDTLWFDAIQKEMSNVRVAFNVLEPDAKPPVGHRKITCHMIFDIKMDFSRKARLVAGGHLTDPPSSITYSSVVSRESVRIAFLIAALNDLDIYAADIGNAYLNAQTEEKVYTVTGKEFGHEAGRLATIVRALYGLKSSGAAWHNHFAQSLNDLNFLSCRSDPDVWRRAASKPDGTTYYEYILVYVDDCLIVSLDPQTILNTLQDEYKYRLKDVGPPKRFLGADIGQRKIGGVDRWFISAETYLKKSFIAIEALFRGHIDTPAPTNFHPEVDDSNFLNDDNITLYQSYIGILRWAIELGRMDIAHFGATMAKFAQAPREGHLNAVVRCFAYLKKRIESRLVIDPIPNDYSCMDWSSKDWHNFYPDATHETIPHDMPIPLGQPVQISLFCDAAHATDLVTRRSTTGFVFFLNGTPIQWYSKRQNTIESSTFGSEFVALKIATEANDALRYKLRMFGVPIDGPTNGFCDNGSVVTNVMNPESTLSKKHNAVAYHKVRECVAMKALQILHEPGKENCSDVFTKFLPAESHYRCCSSMMYR
jgi:Reverse transcriptase (RNA-dependent DNA polymerase)